MENRRNNESNPKRSNNVAPVRKNGNSVMLQPAGGCLAENYFTKYSKESTTRFSVQRRRFKKTQ
jgi:hypothetical protein